VDKVFKGLRPIKREEKIKIGSKDPAKMFCSLCQNEATQFAMFASEGVTVLERYCNTCIKKERHINAH
jgi:hypothetical protein